MGETTKEAEESCSWCGEKCTLSCSNCNKVFYCNREHQKNHWQEHKTECRPWEQKQTNDYGRYLVASRDLPAGTLILKENPFVTGPQARSPIMCIECSSLLQLENFQRCGLCHWPMCGSQCAAAKRHKQECQILRRDVKHCGVPTGEGETPRYDLILVLRCLLLRFTNRSAWKKIQKMESHSEKRKEDAEPHHMAAIRFLKEVCQLENDVDEIHHIRGAIITNSINIKTPLGTVLRGLYTTVSLLNHSCTPNLTLRTNKNLTVFIHTTVPVKNGEILAFSYVSPSTPVWTRSSELYDVYYFACNCKRCLDPTENNTFHSSPRCPNCPDQFLIHDRDYRSNWTCHKCKKQCTLSQIKNEADNFRSSLKDMPEDPSSLREFLEKIAQKYHEDHFLYIEAMQMSLRKIRMATSKDLLKLKIELWKKILSVFNLLEPGSTRRKGVSLVEHAKCLFDVATSLDDPTQKKDYLNQALMQLEEALHILRLEPQDSTEEHWLPITEKLQEKIQHVLAELV